MRGSELTNLDLAATIEYKHEVVRKAIHLFLFLSLLFIFSFLSQFAICLLVPITAAFISVDMARYYIPSIATVVLPLVWLASTAARNRCQEKRLNGASNVLVSSLLCVLLFPKIIAINAITILIISDTTSALVGRRFGRHRFLAKSLEGSLAFFISAVLVILVAPKIDRLPMEYVIGFIAAAIGTVVEALPIKIDDNLTIPISVGFSLWGFYAWLLPAVNLLRLI